MSRSIPLSRQSLDGLPDTVHSPIYKPESVSAGILHFGPGNFHKAHQAVYLDRLMNEGQDLDWGIVGASVMSSDTKLRESMVAQDLLTTVVTQSAEQCEARVTAPMIDYLPIGDTQAIVDTMASPAIRIVSLTVTEGGYFVSAATGAFDSSHPDIQADAADIQNAKSVFGLIVRGLMDRRERGEPAFTVMSCDNLPHNGHAAHAAVVGLARLVDSELANWIEAHSSFPNGMVDRITPATGDHERERVRSLYGIADSVPVFCEDYIQWVLEDNFVSGRPAFENAGVEIVSDVAPFEMMKIRILNGGHAALAYPAALLGIEYAHEAMEDQRIRQYLEKIQIREILPVVPPVPGVDLHVYQQSVVKRFANPAIADTITRLCLDGSNRQPKFIVPTLVDQYSRSGKTEGLVLASAFWCRYCEGIDELGNVIAPNDPSWDRLQSAANASKSDPAAWLAMRDVYGELAQDERFHDSFAQALNGIREYGVAAMLDQYIENY